MATSDDKGVRCSNCDTGSIVSIVRTSEEIGEATFCCTNPKCVIGEFTQKYLTKGEDNGG
jgi:hypothetical protein